MLALLAAARGSPLAIGVDINPRAVALSQLNARLNQSRAQFRCGDMVAPVQGERFDLVFSQPPYVVKPSGVAATTYLHGGSWGDELAMRFVGAVAVVMAPRGRAFFLFDSAVGSREPLPDRLRAALKDAPVDLHVFAASGPSPDFQAMAYASLEAHDLGEVYRTSVWRYRQHLEETGAKSFIRALVVLTDSGVPNGRYTFQLPVPGFSGLDVSSLEEFLSGMELARASREELLAAKVCVSPRARFVEERPATDPQGEPKRSICFDKGALGTDREISEAGLVMFAALQAAPSVAVAAETFGAACGEKPEAVKEQVVSFVREGLLRGLLIAPSTLPPSS
jgi:hypothetical protein